MGEVQPEPEAEIADLREAKRLFEDGIWEVRLLPISGERRGIGMTVPVSLQVVLGLQSHPFQSQLMCIWFNTWGSCLCSLNRRNLGPFSLYCR